jgi:hypothetical protein
MSSVKASLIPYFKSRPPLNVPYVFVPYLHLYKKENKVIGRAGLGFYVFDSSRVPFC